MKYDINTPAPDWAILEARRRMGLQTEGGPRILDWANALRPLRHCAWLITLTEEAPIDPLVLKARRLYCAVNDIDEEFIEKNGGWEGGIRREANGAPWLTPEPWIAAVARVVEILNAEA